MRPAPITRSAWLLRTAQYAAVRLAQSAFEILQFAQQVSATALLLLQVGLNILEHPQEAVTELLGIGA